MFQYMTALELLDLVWSPLANWEALDATTCSHAPSRNKKLATNDLGLIYVRAAHSLRLAGGAALRRAMSQGMPISGQGCAISRRLLSCPITYSLMIHQFYDSPYTNYYSWSISKSLYKPFQPSPFALLLHRPLRAALSSSSTNLAAASAAAGGWCPSWPNPHENARIYNFTFWMLIIHVVGLSHISVILYSKLCHLVLMWWTCIESICIHDGLGLCVS